MHIRLATLEDFKEFKRLYENTVYSFAVNKPTTSATMPLSCKDFMDFLEEGRFTQKTFDKLLNNFIIYLLIDNDTIIGYSILSFVSKRFLKIGEFYIKKSLQFTGKGKFFYSEIEKFAKESKVKQITMFCPFLGAVRFWKKQGFVDNKYKPFTLQKLL